MSEATSRSNGSSRGNEASGSRRGRWQESGVSWIAEELREGAIGFGRPLAGGEAEAPRGEDFVAVAADASDFEDDAEQVRERGRKPFPEQVAAHFVEEPRGRPVGVKP